MSGNTEHPALPIIRGWCTRFPAAITLDERQVRPLAIGVHKQMAAAGVSGKRVRLGLRYYTRSTAYLVAILNGVPRINLDGTTAAAPSEKERAAAHRELTRRVSLRSRPRDTKAPKPPAPTTPAPPAPATGRFGRPVLTLRKAITTTQP